MFAISWPACALLAAGFGALAFATFAPSPPDADERIAEAAQASTPEPVRAPSRPAGGFGQGAWPELIDAANAGLDAEGRVELAAQLGRSADDWCGAILAAAYPQEQDGRVREAILRALRDAECRDCRAVLDLALESGNPTERLLAVEIADGIGESAVLDRALRDRENAVASAAAYAWKQRLNESLLAHLEEHLSVERAAAVLASIQALA